MNEDDLEILLSSGGHLINDLTAIVILIGVPWLILHYLFKFRSGRQLNAEDAAAFARLSQTAERMERRMVMLEPILDAEAPNWRQTSDLGVHYREQV
jgi:phage shock protein B